MTRDFDKVGLLPFLDQMGRRQQASKDPIGAALSTIEETLRTLRAIAERPALSGGGVEAVTQPARRLNHAA